MPNGARHPRCGSPAVCGWNKERHMKALITPGFGIKMGRIAAKILPDRLLVAFAYRTQKKKLG